MNKSSSSSSDSVLSDGSEREAARKNSKSEKSGRVERRDRSRSRSRSRNRHGHRHHHSHSRRRRSRSRDRKHKHHSHRRRSRSRSRSRSRRDEKGLSEKVGQPSGVSELAGKSAPPPLAEESAVEHAEGVSGQQTSAAFDGFQFTSCKQPMIKLHPALRNLPSLNGTNHPALAAIHQLNAARQLAGKPPLTAATSEALVNASASAAANVPVPNNFPKFYNPLVVNPTKQAELELKKRKLWSNSTTKGSEEQEAAAREKWAGVALATGNAECAARLIGLRDVAELEHDAAAKERAAEVRRQQAELFNALERDYELARLATHTHQQAGLGAFRPASVPSNAPSGSNAFDRTKP